MPNSLLEALASGLPAIVSDVPGVVDIASRASGVHLMSSTTADEIAGQLDSCSAIKVRRPGITTATRVRARTRGDGVRPSLFTSRLRRPGRADIDWGLCPMNRVQPQSTRLVVTVAVLLVACIALGVGVAAVFDTPTLVSERSLGVGALTFSAVLALLVFHWTRRSASIVAGPGVLLAAAALGGTFLLGVVTGGARSAETLPQTALYCGIGVTTLLAAGLVGSSLASQTRTVWASAADPDPFRTPPIMLVGVALLAIAAVNLVTGSIPLLSENVDASRFAGRGGLLSPLWVWVIGGIEWLLLLVAAVFLARRRITPATLALATAGSLVLVLLAGRSFLLLIGLAVVTILATLGRMSLPRLLVLAATGLVVLGAVGLARVERSDPTGERVEYLRENNLHGVGGLISQSASIGPWVFGISLQTVPTNIPFQHGEFFIRDLGAQLPFGPLRHAPRADEWVTTEILQRDPAEIGGSPPTLVGGFYIDFGVPGIIIGCALLGFGLAGLFEWARRARTFGALALYGYLSAYVMLAAYSYVSLKPAVIVVTALCLFTHLLERRIRSAPAPDPGPTRDVPLAAIRGSRS